jgi:hypothetical protein
MKLPVVLGVLLFAPLAFASASDYTITILKPDRLETISRQEYQALTNALEFVELGGEKTRHSSMVEGEIAEIVNAQLALIPAPA